MGQQPKYFEHNKLIAAYTEFLEFINEYWKLISFVKLTDPSFIKYKQLAYPKWQYYKSITPNITTLLIIILLN